MVNFPQSACREHDVEISAIGCMSVIGSEALCSNMLTRWHASSINKVMFPKALKDLVKSVSVSELVIYCELTLFPGVVNDFLR